MHLVEFTLSRPPASGQALPEQTLLDVLWSASRPGGGIEHIRVHPSRAGARGVVFCLAADGRQALLRVRSLCERAVNQAPALHGWRLTAVGPAGPDRA
ncbi:hypothetical protein DEJ50_32730 [Streptomyces venezuelae]|uniref:DUF2218 domain-containing protein n=1 Tax=Streptomyces venezuelae TaxID=54571 RepID=A0A5P2D9S4_STRVZ|nr:hypothetical protein [Streptomyces venezuelae]QES51904.1 hypothetical protein DEJ50_32730 [Streptomyces venezuelae]